MADFVITERTKKMIRQMNGREIKLVGRLSLNFHNDICSHYVRIPEKLLLAAVLRQQERLSLTTVGDAIPVKLIEPEGHTGWVKLVKKGHLTYALGGSDKEWPNVVSRNGFKVGLPVDLWAFLDGESNRCFAMEYVREGEPDQSASVEGGESQEGDAGHEGANKEKGTSQEAGDDRLSDGNKGSSEQRRADQHRPNQEGADQHEGNKEVAAA